MDSAYHSSSRLIPLATADDTCLDNPSKEAFARSVWEIPEFLRREEVPILWSHASVLLDLSTSGDMPISQPDNADITE